MPLNESSQSPSPAISKDYGINIREQLFRFLRKWPWFLVSLILFFGLAYVYLRYAIPKYYVYSTILIDNEESASPELDAFKDMGLMGEAKNKIENEIQVLKSRSIMIDVVEKLGLNIQHFSEGQVIKSENYPKSILEINFIDSDSTLYDKSKVFYFHILSELEFEFSEGNKENVTKHSFGNSIETSIGKIVITPHSDNFSGFIDKNIEVRISPVQLVSEYYRNKIVVEPVEKSPSVLRISLNDPVEEKAKDIVNTLINQYNLSAQEDDKKVARKTASFINDRIALITTDLSVVDTDAAKFKASKGLGIDINSQTQRMAESNLQASKEIAAQNAELQIISSLKNNITQSGDRYQIVPYSAGFSDPAVTNLVGQYNQLVNTRDRLLQNSTEQNPYVVNIDNQLGDLRTSMLSSLGSLEQSIKIQLGSLQAQNETFSNKMYAAPQQQQALNEIERQGTIKEQLYLYLLQKREEAEISSGVTTDIARVIDPAIATDSESISPPRNVIYAGSIFAGLFIPFLVIYLGGLLNVKVRTREDLEKVLSTPIIGDIPKTHSKRPYLISKTDRSPLAESFRILKTNLNFLMAGIQSDKGKTIFLTSTISGEGKTFISANLAKVLAASGKKVILIGSDLRDPKFHEVFDLPEKRNTPGLTSYITERNMPVDQIIIRNLTNEVNFDIIPSGPIPPNPTELLESPKLSLLFEKLRKEYDYIVVDTAPVHLVTDTLLISKFADTAIYVVRANYLDKRLLPIAENLYREKRLNNMAVLLNDTDYKGGYGYGYGYGYGNKK